MRKSRRIFNVPGADEMPCTKCARFCDESAWEFLHFLELRPHQFGVDFELKCLKKFVWRKMSENDLRIRLEKPDDWKNVETFVREAFWNVYRPGCSEHYVLHLLRQSPDFVKELDFVMERNGRLVGQNVFAKALVRSDDGKKIPVLTMGPISVAASLRRNGYGKKLLDYSLEMASEQGFGAVFLEGDIAFYGKSGFDYASKFQIRYNDLAEGEDASFFLCKELKPGYLDGISGIYQTPKIYLVDDSDVEKFDKSFPERQKLKLPGQIF